MLFPSVFKFPYLSPSTSLFFPYLVFLSCVLLLSWPPPSSLLSSPSLTSRLSLCLTSVSLWRKRDFLKGSRRERSSSIRGGGWSEGVDLYKSSCVHEAGETTPRPTEGIVLATSIPNQVRGAWMRKENVWPLPFALKSFTFFTSFHILTV